MVWLTFLPAPEEQQVKRLKHQIHGTKQDKLNLKEEGIQNIYEWKYPEGQMYVPRLEPTALNRLADRNHAHGLSCHRTISKSMAQWRTSSTHDSIHTGVIGRCLHVHLTHQIYGVADVFPHSHRATSQTVEAPNPWHQTREITTTSEGRKGVRINANWKIAHRASVCAETPTYGTDSPSR